MKFNFNIDKAEVTGIADLGGINISVDVEAEESITFLKQVLPICKEIKSLRLFETEKDFDKLTKNLNEATDKGINLERELRQSKATADLHTSRLKDELDEKKEKIRELEAQLKEAQTFKKIASSSK